ncbi:MAG: hypothetical protein BBJ57_05705 [Desulfobacterales bacterium PC51MH44]|nr:MAG: hypothetical protein BBJ57_05705 [Desulfobacterales bacterium PC51MH44]
MWQNLHKGQVNWVQPFKLLEFEGLFLSSDTGRGYTHKGKRRGIVRQKFPLAAVSRSNGKAPP